MPRQSSSAAGPNRGEQTPAIGQGGARGLGVNRENLHMDLVIPWPPCLAGHFSKAAGEPEVLV